MSLGIRRFSWDWLYIIINEADVEIREVGKAFHPIWTCPQVPQVALPGDNPVIVLYLIDNFI